MDKPQLPPAVNTPAKRRAAARTLAGWLRRIAGWLDGAADAL